GWGSGDGDQRTPPPLSRGNGGKLGCRSRFEVSQRLESGTLRRWSGSDPRVTRGELIGSGSVFGRYVSELNQSGYEAPHRTRFPSGGTLPPTAASKTALPSLILAKGPKSSCPSPYCVVLTTYMPKKRCRPIQPPKSSSVS